MSEENIEKARRIDNRNTNIGCVGVFLSIFFITGGLYYWLYTFGFIIPVDILMALSIMGWAIFSLIWLGYWCSKKQ